jgi:predicted kinase
MRKWMRDRLKRRKKSEAATGEQPAPLQPAYFQPEEQALPADQEQTGEEASYQAEPTAPFEPPNSDQGEGAREGAPPPSAEQPAAEARRSRRRRRGGRGRRRSGLRRAVQPQGAVAASEVAPIEAAPQPEPLPEAPVPLGAPKGTVVLAIGLPGSGKSSWFKRHNLTPLSSDILRAILFDDPTEQRFQDLVFSNLRSMLRARLLARRPLNYVDATNLTPHDRHTWIKLAKDFGYEVQAVYFDVPLEVCLERNQRRQRVVSEDVMRKMAAKLKPPRFEEGFSKITVVRVKPKG